MSSWFGESLSNLKGQLQNFTKEVLSEAGETEVADETVSLRVKCEELQSVCDTQALEISALRKQNNELQKRLQGDSKPSEEDEGSSWWSVEQRWDASYFGGSSSSSSSSAAAGKQEPKGRGEKDVRIRDLQEKLTLLERQRNEAEGLREENGRLKDLTERLRRDSEERSVLEAKLRDATGKVLELEGELQKVQKQFLDSLGDSQRSFSELVGKVEETRWRWRRDEGERRSRRLDARQGLLREANFLARKKRVVEAEVEKLETEKRHLSSGLEHAVETLGDLEQQEVIHGTLQALELENQVLKIRNAQLEVVAKASSKGGESGWDTLEDHDSRARMRPSEGNGAAQYEDDFDTLSVRSEVSEFSSQHRKQLEAQLAALQEQVDRSDQLKETWAKQKVDLEEKLALMQNKVHEIEVREAETRGQAAEDKRFLSLEAEATAKVVQDLESQLASLQEENVGLNSSLEELDSQHQGALEQLLGVKEALARDHEALRARLLELLEERPKEPLEAAQLGEAVARAFEGLRWRRDTLERKVVELSRERAGMATELDSLRGVLPPIPEEGEAEAWLLVAKDGMESLEGELERARAALEELGGRNAALEAEVQELALLRGRLESVELELGQARAAEGEKNAALQTLVEDLRSEISRRESLELELKQALTTNGETEKVLEEVKEKNAALETLVEDLRSDQSRRESLELELKQAFTTIGETEKALEEVRERNAALETLVADLQSQQSRQKSLEVELSLARTRSSEAEKDLEDLAEKNAALDAQVGELQSRVGALQMDLERARVESEDLRGELGRVRLELKRAAESESETTLERLEEKDAALEDLRVRLKAAKLETEETVQQLRDWGRTAGALLEKYGSETPTEDVGEKSWAEQMRTLENVLQELEGARSARAALEERNSALVTEHSSRVQSLESDVEKALSGKLQAERELKELQERSSSWDEDMERLREEKEALEQRLLDKSPDPELDEQRAALEEAKRNVAHLEEQSAMAKEAVSRLSEVVRDKDAELERLRSERDELVRTVHIKHQESLQYHALLTQNLQQQEDAAGSATTEEEWARLSDENKLLNNELQERAAKEAALQRELERLRLHMVSVEDAYTQETLRAEERAAQLLRRLAEAEELLKSSSTAHTSASILANQQVEALREQAKVLAAQRDEARGRLGDAEDQAHKQLVALRNLQTVLDKFRRDRDRDVQEETAKVRKQLQQAHERHRQLEADLGLVKDQLKEAKEGLKAAARLGQQLEAKDEQARALKARVAELEDEVRKAKEEAAEHLSGAGSKVDRDLVKNLLVGYFSAPAASRAPVLRVMADVLKLSAAEGQQLGLTTTQQGASTSTTPSLSEAFVRFLESESQPQRQLRLLPQQQQQQQRRPSTPSTTPSLLLSEVALPQFSVARNTGAILKDVLKDS